MKRLATLRIAVPSGLEAKTYAQSAVSLCPLRWLFTTPWNTQPSCTARANGRASRRQAGRRLGAATVFQRFLDDAELVETLPCMPRCAVWFADDQIRESATIGGNIVNASPAADGTPALLEFITAKDHTYSTF